MPNHVTNKLIILGVEPERLKKIRLAIKGTEVEPETGEVEAIDFNKIIPMPPSLQVESSSIGDQGLAHLHPELSKYNFYTGEEGKKRWKGLSRKMKTEALKLGRIYYDNLLKYGATTWYDWCTANWGTKWGAYSIQVNDTRGDDGTITEYSNEIQFDTAWATPWKVIRAMSKIFPDAEFSVTFADEDLGQNCGRYGFKNGEETEQYFPDGGSDEAYALAAEVKGWEGEFIKNEATGEWGWKGDFEEEQEDPVGDALDTLIEDGVVTTSHDDHTAAIENEAEANANEG